MNAMPLLPKVLLVEDDPQLARTVMAALSHDYALEYVATGQAALQAAQHTDYDVIMLDVHLPDGHGLTICKQLRERGNQTAILVVSGEANILTKIHLLDAGANDYLTKPFSLGELKARLRVLLRKQHLASNQATYLTVGDLRLDRQGHTVQFADQLIALRRKEFALLECLMEHAGSVVTRQALTRYVWQGADELWTNTVEVHVKHLRDKLDRRFGVSMIHTVYGLGYKLDVTSRLTMSGR